MLDDKYNQREKFVTSLEGRLADTESQIVAFRYDGDTLRAANIDLPKRPSTKRDELSSLRTRVLVH